MRLHAFEVTVVFPVHLGFQSHFLCFEVVVPLLPFFREEDVHDVLPKDALCNLKPYVVH